MKIFLCGDVMTGRGIDQVLPYPSDPVIHEAVARSALDYVELAERVNGAVDAPVDFDYVWGDALSELSARRPDARVVNLETSITTSDAWQPKGINYRMHPRNVGCLTAASIDCCALANNHVMDWGPSGLVDTLATLDSAGIETAGAGADRESARSPGVVSTATGRVLVFAFGAASSGIPRSWAATDSMAGVSYLRDLSSASADEVVDRVGRFREPDDVVVASIHWGGNWGYAVPPAHRTFAHRLIDSEVVDLIHGHSSHHPRGIELYRGRPILYGCGDFLNDYEGIPGYEEYRDDLVLMYFVTLVAEAETEVRLVPLRIRRFRLWRASESDAEWLQRRLDRESRRFGTRVEQATDGSFEVRAA